MKKILLTLTVLLFLLGGILIYQNIIYNDKRLHVVVCDVGQGDAIFVRTPQGSDILIDGGPDDSVLNCLSKHMPFWDRTIEIVILSHPHTDHFAGLNSILKSYKVKLLVREDLVNDKALGFKSLKEKTRKEKIPEKIVFAGDRFILKDGVVLKIVGPTQEFIRETSPGGTIGESSEFASLESLLTFGKFSVLFTGDSQVAELEEMLKQVQHDSLDVLQVPHHGSRFGLNADILDALNPKLAVISVGKNNKYGHPTPFTLEILRNKDIKILRTDQNGEIEIISDGQNFKAN